MMVTNPFGDVATMRDEERASRIFRSGSRLGRYELLTRVGQGGMASVWAARQHGERGFIKAVAVKTILPHLASEQEFETLFLREARIASTIRHPNVCEVYDLGEDAGALYMAMEWINGDSLASLLHGNPSSGPLHWPLVARIIADACAGLHAAHTTRDVEGRPMMILHRDISPQNVLLSDSGIVKLADFGIAKASMSLSAMTRAGFMRGKVCYSAPERVSGAAYDQRADIYAMGCVLYELLTGRPPFGGKDDVRLLVDITAGRYRPIPASLDLPPSLVSLVARAIAADPDERIQSADELRVSLETLLFERKCLVSASHLAGIVRSRLQGRLQARQRAIQATLERIAREGGGGVPPSLAPPPPPPPPPSMPVPAPREMVPPLAVPVLVSVPPAPISGFVTVTEPPRYPPAARGRRVMPVLAAVVALGAVLFLAAGRLGYPSAKIVSRTPVTAPPAPAPTLPRPVATAEPSAPPPATAAPVIRATAQARSLPPSTAARARPLAAAANKTSQPRGEGDDPVDPLELNLPQVPAVAPQTTTPSNPY